MNNLLPLNLLLFLGILFSGCNSQTAAFGNQTDEQPADSVTSAAVATPKARVIDSADYIARITKLANGDTTGRWPVKNPIPLPGAILPYYRVVAYYGNLFSKKMGILGELPKSEMIAKLKKEADAWGKADTTIPVMPALHYIAVTAQSNGGKQRLRMPFRQIDTIRSWAQEINAITFVDVQVGQSTLQEEIPELERYLSYDDVHLGIDPEFSMKNGEIPGKKIGTFDAADINYVIDYLANLVKTKNLPPKILVVHRFTQGMLTNAASIKRVPEVQVVINMDGWGSKVLKRSTWLRYIQKEPVQFTGFKLFYKNDTKADSTALYTPEELLKFTPNPIYIQYQ